VKNNGAAGISFAKDTGAKGHERMGSWELRQKEFGRRESLDERPVEPHERV
jgi:hypothetical protein